MQNQSKLRLWSGREDDKLRQQMITTATGKQNWETVSRKSGLKRSANSCRLRWENHLKPGTRPDRKLTDEEKLLILEFRSLWGGRNCWSKIAKHLLPGRRDNDVKNFWHTFAKRAKREGRDVDEDAFRKRAELVDTIRAAGKFTMDYSSSIRSVAFEKLKELLPDLAAAGAEVAASSSVTAGAVSSASNLGTSNYELAATDTGAADAVTSCYSVEFGLAGFISEEQFLEALGIFTPISTLSEINNPDQQLLSSRLVDHGGGPTGSNQVQAAQSESSNQGWRSQLLMQGSGGVDAPQFHAPAEQHQQQLGFYIEDFYRGGGAAEFNQAMAAASFHDIRHFSFN